VRRARGDGLADEAETFAVPDAMPFDEAGAFPIAYMSSHVAIRWQGRLEAGETLLVLGAAGGVGLTAVEIGKAMGARVIAGASTADKLAVARERGADETVNYATEKLTERVLARPTARAPTCASTPSAATSSTRRSRRSAGADAFCWSGSSAGSRRSRPIGCW